MNGDLEIVVDGFSEFYQEFCREFEAALEDEIRHNELKRLAETHPELPEPPPQK